MIAEPALASVLNVWLQRLLNETVPGADKLLILRIITSFFFIWIAKRCISFVSSVIKAKFICNAKQDIRHGIFTTLFRLDTSSISAVASSGEYISLFTNDIAMLETRYYNQILNLVGNIFSVLVLGFSFVVMCPKLAVAIIAFGIISMLVPLACSKSLNAKSLTYSNSISSLTQRIKEYMVAYPTIKNYSIEDNLIKRFDQHNTSTEDAKFESDAALALANSIGSLLSWFMQFIGVGLGAILVIRGEILIGTVIAAQAFASDLAYPLQDIIQNFNSIRSVNAIVKKMKLYATAGTVEDKNKSEEPPILPDELCSADGVDVEFRDLTIELGGRNIVDHFSFKFERNKKYLVVGLNGSGKSSVFKALKKWFGYYNGNILINNTDITQHDSQSISRIISYMNENVSMFSGTVMENISLFRDYTQADLDKAINDSRVNLNPLKNISDEGCNISSGERRRIEIARSLLSSAKVLIFDEVISTLDIETAYEIERLALDFSDKTIIFVSHNFSGKLMREYDEIIVMGDGHVISHGHYNELIENCDYFKKICSIKFG